MYLTHEYFKYFSTISPPPRVQKTYHSENKSFVRMITFGNIVLEKKARNARFIFYHPISRLETNKLQKMHWTRFNSRNISVGLISSQWDYYILFDRQTYRHTRLQK